MCYVATSASRSLKANRLADTFTYRVTDYNDDGLISNEATVTVIIDCERGAIKANPDYASTPEDQPVTLEH